MQSGADRHQEAIISAPSCFEDKSRPRSPPPEGTESLFPLRGEQAETLFLRRRREQG